MKKKNYYIVLFYVLDIHREFKNDLALIFKKKINDLLFK